VLAAALLVGWLACLRMERTLVGKFSGRRWDFPSRVYADATPLVPGLGVLDESFRRRLGRLGYQPVDAKLRRRGQYRILTDGSALDLWLRVFEYPTHREPGRLLRLWLGPGGRVVRVVARETGQAVYDASLEPVLIAGLQGERPEERREMSLSEVPVPLVRSLITVEDRRFFEHAGVDPRGLLRALVADIKAGAVRQGGSTITQQLMKNFFLGSERTLGRKLEELVMALIAERRFSKEEILENYLNEIYLGSDGPVAIHGMWEGARYYFGRSPTELTLGQIATLVGIIRAPNAYSPHQHPDRALSLRNVVLGQLLAVGDIDEKTYREAIAEPLGTVPPRPRSSVAPYFIDAVRRELGDRFPRQTLQTEGYSIFTTLDLEIQDAAEAAVAEGLAELERRYPALTSDPENPLQAALVALSPGSGRLQALVGGRDYRQSQFNRVLDARRQPGSVFKPIVYATALSSEQPGNVHFTPVSFVDDQPLEWEFDGDVWSPSNYEDVYHGRVTLRVALERSMNVATARVARAVGIPAIRSLAVRMGIPDDLPEYPSIALGGWGVRPIDIARVYSVFANGGVRAFLHVVTDVTDRHGQRVEGRTLDVERVLPETDAYLLTHMLEGVLDRGTGRRVRRLGFTRPAAGKTGTTNDFNDAWFAGYTPDLLAVVWVGFDQPRSLDLTGAGAALPIWTRFMRRALRGRAPSEFRVPDGVVLREIDADTGELAGRGCPNVVREAFLEGEEPRRRCSEHGEGLPDWLEWSLP